MPQRRQAFLPFCCLAESMSWLRLWSHRAITRAAPFAFSPSCIGSGGRSCANSSFGSGVTAYRKGFMVESPAGQAAHADAPLSGFVLDIQKCFNALPRRPMHALLCHLGCPDTWATMWVNGLGRLGRASSFIGDVSEPVWSSTGAPEGDGVSVAAAVAIGWLYSQVIEDYGLSPLIFVDNWAWVSEDHELNTAGVEQTVRFAEAFRLSIDWQKSFGWSRHKAGQRWWHDHCATAGPSGVTLQVLAETKDLGAAMRYHGPRVLGALKARVQEAQQRLHRLAAQPRSVTNKARLVQTAIWPAAFFACEGHALGQQRIAGLRACAARALVGPFRQLSPYLALSCLSKGLQDPEVFLLVSAMRALRRAWFVDRAMAEDILAAAVQASGHPSTVIGPATALKALLVRNGWCLHSTALATGPGNVKVHLFTSSSHDIARAVQIGWLYHVRGTLRHRNGLQDVGVPCPTSCSAVLRKLPSAHQRTVALHVVGAFQTTATKFLWGGAHSPACPWCGVDETRPHRFLHCSAFAALRQKHAQAVQVLREQRPEWVYAPFPTVPDEVDILTLIFQSRPPPAWPSPSWAAVQEPSRSLRFYTDGTCANPTEPPASHAAWALVQDCTVAGQDRQDARMFWLQTRAHPPHLRVVDRGLVPGTQSIQRAELCAALQAVRHGRQAGQVPTEVVTDSAYVFRIFERASDGTLDAFLPGATNCDLLLLLREAWFPFVRARKVKSHLDPCACTCPEQQWDAIGNSQADAACKHALEGDLPVVGDMIASAAKQLKQQKQQLHVVFQYLVELHGLSVRQLNGTNFSSAREHEQDGPVMSMQSPAVRKWIQARSQIAVSPPMPTPAASVLHSFDGEFPLLTVCGFGCRRCNGMRIRRRTFRKLQHLSCFAILWLLRQPCHRLQ